jgi:putative copper resistance protein D
MTLLVDLFGFLSVVLRGCVLALGAFTLGGVVFRHFVLPVAVGMGPAGHGLALRLARFQRGTTLGVAVLASLALSLEVSVLMGTVGVHWTSAITAPFALAEALVISFALVLALITRAERPWRAVEIGAAAALLGGVVITTHALGRLEGRSLLFAMSTLHQAAGAAWIGGLPFFLMALAASLPPAARAAIGQRFSQVCVAAVLTIFGTAAVKTLYYIGEIPAVYGTAYGLMTSTKAMLFVALLGFGLANFLAVRRMAADERVARRVRHFVEVELALGLAVFFIAGSLTSLPPAVDLPHDRATWSMIVERVLTPRPPRLSSPDYAELAYANEQARIDQLVAEEREEAALAFTPGSGILSPRTAGDIAWSEYNHNWSGLFILAIGVLALIAKAPGGQWARHWPLLFITLGIFVAIRSDPETWPLGGIGFFESFRDPEVAQHRLAALLVCLFGIFEWQVRMGRLRRPWAADVFPISNVLGGIMLLTHSHNLENFREALLIEMSHIPLALFGIAAGCARWLELRCDSPLRERAGWVWPLCFVAIGLVLLAYRES